MLITNLPCRETFFAPPHYPALRGGYPPVNRCRSLPKLVQAFTVKKCSCEGMAVLVHFHHEDTSSGYVWGAMSQESTALETLTTLLGPPDETGWRLTFPDRGLPVCISLRTTFGSHGAVWFEEPDAQAARNWWVPLDFPGAADRVEREVSTLLAEGARVERAPRRDHGGYGGKPCPRFARRDSYPRPR